MSENNIPLIPELRFDKTNFGYVFQSTDGKIISQNSEIFFEINDIVIIISDSINLSFSMKTEDCQTFFPPGEIYSKTFNIKCKCQIYTIYIYNCIEVKSNIGDVKIRAHASQIKFFKNDEKFNGYELVKVWNILESELLSDKSTLLKFKSHDLKNIFLKSIKNSQNSAECHSFNQLLNNNWFLFYETRYRDIGNDSMVNLEKLLMFFDVDDQPIRMRIIEDVNHQKLEIIIDTKFSKNPKLESIFLTSSLNFVDFIDSTYSQYCKLKKSEIDIDLLLHYYVLLKNESYLEARFILSSIFMEVFKNNRLCPFQNKIVEFNHKINNRFLYLGINPVSIFESLYPNVYSVFDIINEKFIIEYSKKDVNYVVNYFKKHYLISLIEYYRNKSVHSGMFKLDEKKLKEFINKKWILNYKKDLSKKHQVVADEIKDELIEEFCKLDGIFSRSQQSQSLEFLIEIVLLRLLRVNCTIDNLEEYKLKMENPGERINSKKFVNKYLIKICIGDVKTILKVLFLKIKSYYWKLPYGCKCYIFWVNKFSHALKVLKKF